MKSIASVLFLGSLIGNSCHMYILFCSSWRKADGLQMCPCDEQFVSYVTDGNLLSVPANLACELILYGNAMLLEFLVRRGSSVLFSSFSAQSNLQTILLLVCDRA